MAVKTVAPGGEKPAPRPKTWSKIEKYFYL